MWRVLLKPWSEERAAHVLILLKWRTPPQDPRDSKEAHSTSSESERRVVPRWKNSHRNGTALHHTLLTLKSPPVKVFFETALSRATRVFFFSGKQERRAAAELGTFVPQNNGKWTNWSVLRSIVAASRGELNKQD